ncbi:hypothetical protein LPR20_003843, partial [Vibrio mimicus]
MEISDVVDLFRNPKVMASYGTFYSQMFPSGQFVFSKEERVKIRNFYELVNALPPSKRSDSDVLGKLKTLVDSLDFIEAGKKKVKRRHARQPKYKKKLQFHRPTLSEVIESRKNLPTIGLGIEPVTVIPKVKSMEVVIDSHTTLNESPEKHILYVAGFSLKETEVDESVS